MQPYIYVHFEGVVKATNLDNKYTGGEVDTDPVLVKNLVEKIGLNNVNILKGTFLKKLEQS